MATTPTLQTERLLLRPYARTDFEAYAAMWADPAVVRFIGGTPLSREQSWVRFLRKAGMWQLMGFGFLVLEDRATGALFGEAGFQDMHRALTPSLEGTLETGWALVRQAQGRGLAEEAARAVLDWGTQHLPGLRVTCMIDPDHHASLRVATKLGFAEFARSDYHGMPMALLEMRRA